MIVQYSKGLKFSGSRTSCKREIISNHIYIYIYINITHHFKMIQNLNVIFCFGGGGGGGYAFHILLIFWQADLLIYWGGASIFNQSYHEQFISRLDSL